MKNIFHRGLRLVAICIMGLAHTLHAQPVYKITDSKDVGMKLSGTSTLHNWSMNARTFDGEAQFGFMPGDDHRLTSIPSLTFSLEVANLKSEEKGLDKNAYKALKTNQYKDISYQLTSAIVAPEQEGKYLIKTHGNLRIAGITREITMDVYCVVNKDATIRCSGSDKLKMTDYKVKPPSFMLGAMTTGDDLSLDFILVYKK